MAQATVTATADPLARKARLAGLVAIASLLVFGAVAGAVLMLAQQIVQDFYFAGSTWKFAGFDAPVVLFTGVPCVLGGGWVMLALWQMGERKWAFGGLAAIVLVGIAAVMAGLAPSYDLSLPLAGALGLMEALVAGIWMADMFGCLTRQGITGGLAADIYLLMGFLVLFHGEQTIALPVLMALMLVSPLAAITIVARFQKEKQPSKPKVLAKPLTWAAIGFFVLPLALGAGYYLATFIMA